MAINLESSRLIVICRSRLGESWCGDDGADSDKGKKDFRGDRRTNGVRLADDVSSAPAVCFCGFARNGAVLRTSRASCVLIPIPFQDVKAAAVKA